LEFAPAPNRDARAVLRVSFLVCAHALVCTRRGMSRPQHKTGRHNILCRKDSNEANLVKKVVSRPGLEPEPAVLPKNAK